MTNTRNTQFLKIYKQDYSSKQKSIAFIVYDLAV